jgi:hypothetical protein
MADMITVVALRDGFCVGRRKVGQEFQVPAGTTASWFVPVDKGTPGVAPPDPKTLTLPRKGGRPKSGAEDLL